MLEKMGAVAFRLKVAEDIALNNVSNENLRLVKHINSARKLYLAVEKFIEPERGTSHQGIKVTYAWLFNYNHYTRFPYFTKLFLKMLSIKICK